MNTNDLKQALRNGPYAWPGGYPTFFITDDGAALSHRAVMDNFPLVLSEMRHPGTCPGWGIAAHAINWEEPHLMCDHTGEPIPSAYSEDLAA